VLHGCDGESGEGWRYCGSKILLAVVLAATASQKGAHPATHTHFAMDSHLQWLALHINAGIKIFTTFLCSKQHFSLPLPTGVLFSWQI